MTNQERAEKIVNLVCKLVYDDMPTSFDGLDFSPIEAILDEAVSSAQMEWEGSRLPVALGLAYEQGFAAARVKGTSIAKEHDDSSGYYVAKLISAMEPDK